MSVQPPSVKGQRRAELAAFLRTRRGLISPEDAGLPPGLRRRTPGLRREELAQLAGVGVTWYTWLEQGRPINVSPQILDAVAGVLKLGQTEHAHLYRLADMPQVPDSPECIEALSPDLQLVLDGLTEQAACVYSSKYDLLAWNDNYAALFPGITSPGADRNALWHCFQAHGTENPLGTLEHLAYMVATARGAYARHVGEPEWTAWVHRLSAASPEFAAMWASNRISAPAPLTKEFTCSGMGTFHARTASFGVIGAPDARLLVYLPAGPEDVALLRRMRQIRRAGAVRTTPEARTASLSTT